MRIASACNAARLQRAGCAAAFPGVFAGLASAYGGCRGTCWKLSRTPFGHTKAMRELSDNGTLRSFLLFFYQTLRLRLAESTEKRL